MCYPDASFGSSDVDVLCAHKQPFMSIMLFGTCPYGEEIFRHCSVKLPLTWEDKKCLVSSHTNKIHGQTVSWSRNLPYLDGGGKRIHVTNHCMSVHQTLALIKGDIRYKVYSVLKFQKEVARKSELFHMLYL